jgi:hypothetical protein
MSKKHPPLNFDMGVEIKGNVIVIKFLKLLNYHINLLSCLRI